MQEKFIEEDEIDLKDLFSVLKRYKYSILSIMLLATFIAFIFAFYKPNIYEAKSTIQIGLNGSKPQIASGDIIQNALNGGGSSSDMDTEIAIVKSRFLVLDAMKSVDMTSKIWGVDKFYKSHELYIDTPYTITVNRGKDLLFHLTPINNNFFTLEVEGKDANGVKFKDKANFEYGKVIKRDAYELKIDRNEKPIIFKKYKFITYNKKYYADTLRAKDIKVSPYNKKSNILEISYSDSVPLRAKEFIDALSHSYMKQSIELKTKDATKTLEFVNRQLALLESQLKISEKKIEEFKKKQKTVNVSMSAEHLSKTLADYESQIGILDMQISILKNIVYKIRKGAGLESVTLVGIGVDNSNSVALLVKELQQVKLERKALLEEFTPQHPEVRKVQAKIRNLKRIVKDSVSNILRGLAKKRELLSKQMGKYQKELKKLPKVQQNYLSLERNFTFNEKFYTYLLEKKTETEIKRAATVSQNRIIDLPLIPKEPIKPKRKLIVIVGAITGLILGIFVAFFRNFFNSTIDSIEMLEKRVKTPIVASIPKYKTKSKKSRELYLLDKPKSAASESTRTLRTNIKYMLKGDNPKVIALTSTIAAEGKTSISSNLGLSLQMIGKKVIILNFDLRKPTLHTLFGVQNTKGLSAFLSDHAQLDEIIVNTGIDNLDIIPAGSPPPNPSELIVSDLTNKLLVELKKSYDYILIDTPPIGLVTDARVLLSKADTVLYVVRAHHAKMEFVKTINWLSKQEDIKSMGIILNGVSGKDGYGYGYGGYYGD